MDFIYSKTLVVFISRLVGLTKTILSGEMGVEVVGRRFYYRGRSYRIDIHLFEGSSKLGYFDQDSYHIGITKDFLFRSEVEIKNLLRHELAHYLIWLGYKGSVAAHGAEFRELCQRCGWGREVYQAKESFTSESSSAELSSKEELIFNKVQKLMALSNSSNQFESEQAALKANALLMKHNLSHLDGISPNQGSEEEMIIRRTLRAKRWSPKLTAISEILRTFFVYPVQSSVTSGVYMEIYGSRINVKIADHIANFLVDEMERLWLLERKARPALKGAVAKNSFFEGLAGGYCDKVERERMNLSQTDRNQLMVIKNSLVDSIGMAYQNLRTQRSSRQYCEEATALGRRAGSNLRFQQAVERTDEGKVAALTHQGE